MEPSLRAWAETLIDRRTLETQGILNPDTVWKIWKDFVENGVWRIQIWYILMFQPGWRIGQRYVEAAAMTDCRKELSRAENRTFFIPSDTGEGTDGFDFGHRGGI